MDENRAAATRYTWPRVVVELDDEIVEAVVTAQPVAWFIGRLVKGPIVAAVCRVLTPCIAGPDAADREESPWAKQSICPVPQAHGMKPAGGSCAVTFALVGFDTAAAERNPPRHPAGGEQPAFGAPARPGFDADKAKRSPSHGVPSPNSQPGLALVSFAA